MSLNPISKEEALQAKEGLKQALKTIISIGDYTQQDRSTRREYVNIIIEIGHLQQELIKHVKKPNAPFLP